MSVRIDKPPYKDVQNRYRTESLFYETIRKSELDREIYWPIFTLREEDYKPPPSDWYQQPLADGTFRYKDGVIPSLRKIYLQYSDPAEYEFSMKVFHSDRHWKILQGCEFFKPYLAEWRQTLAKKLESEAVMVMRDLAVNGPGPQALQAAKWLAERSHFDAPRGKGRPSNQEVAKETRLQVEQARMLKEDAERMGLMLVNSNE